MKKNILQKNKSILEKLQEISCLYAVILGISGCLISVVDVRSPWKISAAAAAIICGGHFIGSFGKKQRYIITGMWIAGIILVLKNQWELLENGAKGVANQVIEIINHYYGTEMLLWYQKENVRDIQWFFLLMLLGLGIIESLLFYIRKEKIKWMAKAVIPILLILGGLTLGKPCSFWGSFWLLTAVFLGKLLPVEKGMGKNALILVIVMVLAITVTVTPFGEWIFVRYHDSWHELQGKMEDSMIAVGERFWNSTPDRQAQKDIELSNSKPQRNGTEMFSVTLKRPPEHSLYLRGFIGETYENGNWDAGEEQSFSNLAQSLGYSSEEYARMIQNMPCQLWTESGVDIQEMRINKKEEIYGYTLMPYYSLLEDEMQVRNDGIIRPDERKEYEVQGCVSAANEKPWIETSGRKEEPWQKYAAYVKEHNLAYPDTGLERMVEKVEKVKKNQQFQQRETQELVKNILWEDTHYSLELKKLPSEKEFAEYFLFEQKKGYCVHYATAGTLLFRMFGIPARYVSGYVVYPSDFTEDSDGNYTAVVTDERAHAWTEIFWEGAGFYPVEVTPSDNIQEQEDGVMGQQEVQEIWTQQEEPPQKEEAKEEAGKELQETVNEEQLETIKQEQQTGEGAMSLWTRETEEERMLADKEISRKVRNIILILAAMAVARAVLIQAVKMRRTHVLKRKQKIFLQKDRSRGTLALGKEIYRILEGIGYGKKKGMTELEYGIWLQEQSILPEQEMDWNQFITLQQQAAFSKKPISEEQWSNLWILYEDLKAYLILGENRRKILYWKYIKILC